MASATLALSSVSASIFVKSSLLQHHKQTPLSLSLSKPNCSFLSPPLPPSRLSLFPLASQRPIFDKDTGKLSPSEMLDLLKTISPFGDSEPDIQAIVEKYQRAQNKPPRKVEEIFAVVMIGSRQYIVIPGRWIYTPRLKGANVNDKIVLNKVLLVGTKNSTYVGLPVVTNAAVHAVVEEQLLDDKVIVFKYKRKKNYRRNIGHRQPITRIKITGITGYEEYPASTLDS